MIQWKAGITAIIVGTGAICSGCGVGTEDLGEDAAAASVPTEGVQLATVRFSVEGMTCGGCAIATEMSVKRVEGVRSVTASLGEVGGPGSATVEYDPDRAGTEAIAAAIRKAGFTPSIEDRVDSDLEN